MLSINFNKTIGKLLFCQHKKYFGILTYNKLNFILTYKKLIIYDKHSQIKKIKNTL